MNTNQLIYGAPVVLLNSESMTGLSPNNKHAQEFQESLERRPKNHIVIITSKTCKGCLEDKELVEFRKNPTTRDGKRGKCKACENNRERKRYSEKNLT